MVNIILKKTHKQMDTKWTNEKSFSFHGNNISEDLIDLINSNLAEIPATKNSGTLKFTLNDKNGHFFATMNHDAQKYREEDYTVCILDTMESLGWTFRFQ